MYYENNNQKESLRRARKFDNFLADNEDKDEYEEAGEELLEAPHDMLLPEKSHDVLYRWKGPEFEVYERDKKWYWVISAILFLIIVWALYSNSMVMAITFILIGVVGYIYINKDPRELDYTITYDGVIVGNELYRYENLESFWIFYEPPYTKILSLNTRGVLLPFVHIPLHDEDPIHVREVLLDHIPERKQEEGLVEILERLLRL